MVSFGDGIRHGGMSPRNTKRGLGGWGGGDWPPASSSARQTSPPAYSPPPQGSKQPSDGWVGDCLARPSRRAPDEDGKILVRCTELWEWRFHYGLFFERQEVYDVLIEPPPWWIGKRTPESRMILTDLGSTSEVGFRLFLGAKRKTEGFTR